MNIKAICCKLFGKGIVKPVPALIENRNNGNFAAIIFVHGFRGHASTTWTSFLDIFLNDYRLKDWDAYCAGYSTSLSIDLPIWASDPDIKLCAIGLATKLRHPPLDRYDAIALVAHSMGGLIAQRAILDSDQLRKRVTHLILYGTPSAGLSKTAWGARLKPQARDMQIGSDFIKQLREEWQLKIGETPSFSLAVVAGENDAFVPASSSIDPFPIAQQSVIPGNHLEIVRPDSIDHLSYRVVYKTLTGSNDAHSAVESARLAVEHKEFNHAIELLMPGSDGLDANAVVTLALALESVGRKSDAMEVLDRWNRKNNMRDLDPIGALAGRLKRRWLVSRQQQDLDRAIELYSTGLELAESRLNHDQAYYHAINVAFLKLVSAPGDGPAPSEVEDLARRALSHIEASSESRWTHATLGEAWLMLGKLKKALNAYRNARKLAKNLRECESMHMQAVAVATRVFGEEGAKSIDEVFGFYLDAGPCYKGVTH